MRNGKRTICLFFVLVLTLNMHVPLARGQERVKPTVYLQILIDRQPSETDHPILIKPDQSIALRVELVRSVGSNTDVTGSSKTSYFSLTPWSVIVSNDGVVTVADTRDFDPKKMADHELGSIVVTYGLAGEPEIGAATILFKVVQ